jgi:hypothetical protein
MKVRAEELQSIDWTGRMGATPTSSPADAGPDRSKKSERRVMFARARES